MAEDKSERDECQGHFTDVDERQYLMTDGIEEAWRDYERLRQYNQKPLQVNWP